METKDVIRELRTKAGLSQDELAEKLFVTRQAVSRWENGETVPNTETLKLLSKLFSVSINTLLGSPQQLVCQELNEEYCNWCYAGGEFKYSSPEQLIDFCVEHMASEAWPPEQVRAHMEAVVSGLRHWRK